MIVPQVTLLLVYLLLVTKSRASYHHRQQQVSSLRSLCTSLSITIDYCKQSPVPSFFLSRVHQQDTLQLL